MKGLAKFLLCAGLAVILVLPATAGASPEKLEIKLISLYDNYSVKPGFKTAWGFSTLVKVNGEAILFDTGGDSEILLYNMKKLGINPSSIRKVVISHIHSDHLGGLRGFLEKNSHVEVFIPRSFPPWVKRMIRKKGARYVEISAPAEISDHVYTTGELEGPPAEQSLIIDSTKGLVIITGCAHPGVLKIIRKAREITGKEKVYLVLGGFHHPPLRVVGDFRALGVLNVAPSHCTGDRQRRAFEKEYGPHFIPYGVGKTIVIR